MATSAEGRGDRERSGSATGGNVIKPIPKSEKHKSQRRTAPPALNDASGEAPSPKQPAPGKFSQGGGSAGGLRSEGSSRTGGSSAKHDWATRALMQCCTEDQKDRMRSHIKHTIRTVERDNGEEVDWSSKPLPTLPEWQQSDEYQPGSKRRRTHSEQPRNAAPESRDLDERGTTSPRERRQGPDVQPSTSARGHRFEAVDTAGASGNDAPPSQQCSNNSPPVSSDAKEKQKKPTQNCYCSICDCWMNTQSQYEKHTQGRRHQENASLAGVDPKNPRSLSARRRSKAAQSDPNKQSQQLQQASDANGMLDSMLEPNIDAPIMPMQTEEERIRLEKMTLDDAVEQFNCRNGDVETNKHGKRAAEVDNEGEQGMDFDRYQLGTAGSDLLGLQPIIGTCSTLEKSYFRLKSAPDPSEVRPPEVIECALNRLQQLNPQPSWHYLNDKLKAMRQDLTVQHIRTELTVRVHEIHGRGAIDACDWQEFDQCQHALRRLYAEGCDGNEAEFLAYRILWATATWEKNVETATGTLRASKDDVLADLHVAARWRRQNNGYPPVVVGHALSVRDAAMECNVPRFLSLASNPVVERSAQLLSLALEPLRMRCADAVVRTMRPNINLEDARLLLGFSTKSECEQWLKWHGGRFDEEGKLDCKASVNQLHEAAPNQIQEQTANAIGLADFMVGSSG